MDSSIQLFDNGKFIARTITDENGEIWVVARDVAQALEYERFDSNLLKNVPDIWKGTKRIRTPGGEQEMLCLTEQGLYFFLGRSDKPKALPYQMWVAGDVIPSIRKTGKYKLNQDANATVQFEPMQGAKLVFEMAGISGNQLVLALDKVYKKHAGYSALQVANIALVAPTKCQLLTPTEIGKHFGVSGRKVNSLLCKAGYQHRVGKNLEPLELGQPYAVMLDTGKQHSDGTPVRQLKWESQFLIEIDDLFQPDATLFNETESQ